MEFLIAILPILVVLIGMVFFHRSGTFVSIIGWILTAIVAVYYFKTPWNVVWGASLVGIVKALGITLAVTFTMLLIFIMKETGALKTIIDYVKGITRTKEEQALFIGMGFGSLSTALGMVTPAMFPPIFRLLGFAPIAAIGISILCYDPLTSFALFSIPVTLPAKVATLFGIKPPGIANVHEFIWDFAYKITVFLPPVSVMFAFLMLLMVGGTQAMKRHWVAALLSGLVLSGTAFLIARFRILPVETIGIAAGFTTMLFTYFYYRSKVQDHSERPRFGGKVFKAASPFILLILFSIVVNIPSVKKTLANVLGSAEVFHLFAQHKVDLNIFAHVWFWIFVVCILSIFILRPSSEQLENAFSTWIKRIWGPFIAYSLFFAVAFIMAWSAMEVVNGKLTPGPYFKTHNMDMIIAMTLKDIFGKAYPLIAPFLGLIGAFVGGSETASNVLFAKIQWGATVSTLGAQAFMWIYAAHAVGGGIASAITPSKITNAAATIGVSGREEGRFIKAVLLPVLFMVLVTGIILTLIVYF